ncbi:MAG TPA: acyl-CoA carboxylase subunit epsilon [Mycobacteriales bacterium]|jgi:hypothetical protein
MTPIRVVRGKPTDEEFAAAVVVLMARARARAAAGRGRDHETQPSGWLDRTALVRAPLRSGPSAWRASGFRR